MATRWCGSTLPASDASAPFGMRMATAGMCSNESGIDSKRMFIAGAPFRSRVRAICKLDVQQFMRAAARMQTGAPDCRRQGKCDRTLKQAGRLAATVGKQFHSEEQGSCLEKQFWYL